MKKDRDGIERVWVRSGLHSTREWVEIGVITPPEMVEAICDFMMENGSVGVLVESEDARYPDHRYFNWTLVKAFFKYDKVKEVESKFDEYLKKLKELFPSSEPPVVRKGLVDNEYWNFRWKRYFEPVEIYEDFVIAPAWYDKKNFKRKNKTVVLIDPGMTFGTGVHPTTKLAIKGIRNVYELLDKRRVMRKKLLDVGTGSGVLAISASKFGFYEVLGIDIDPEAVKVSRKNVEVNNCQHNTFILRREVSVIDEEFDCVVANIDTKTLISMKRELSRVVNRGGYLVLSGIRWNEAADIKSEFVTQRFEFLQVEYEQGWSGMIFHKR